jgi:hypothetical protein
MDCSICDNGLCMDCFEDTGTMCTDCYGSTHATVACSNCVISLRCARCGLVRCGCSEKGVCMACHVCSSCSGNALMDPERRVCVLCAHSPEDDTKSTTPPHPPTAPSRNGECHVCGDDFEDDHHDRCGRCYLDVCCDCASECIACGELVCTRCFVQETTMCDHCDRSEHKAEASISSTQVTGPTCDTESGTDHDTTAPSHDLSDGETETDTDTETAPRIAGSKRGPPSQCEGPARKKHRASVD